MSKKKLNIGWYNLYLKFGDYIDESLWEFVTFKKTTGSNPIQIDNHVMVFTKPLHENEELRIIPGFPRYAVSNIGRIVDRETGVELKNYEVNANGNWYPTVKLYLPHSEIRKGVAIHRLVALAWCENDNWHDKVIVNHKDGDKNNYHYLNLEWVTYSENACHAFEAGLRTDNIRVKIRNKDTGEIIDFYSLGAMSRYFGIGRAKDPLDFEAGPPHRLFMKYWEVRTERDDRPWYYKVGEAAIPHSRYKTTVTYPDGRQEIYWDNRDIIKKFKCWNVSSGIDSVIAKAKFLNPDLTFIVEDRWKDRMVETIKVSTMEIVDTSPWMRNAMRIMGVSKYTVTRLLRCEDQRTINGYAVRYKTDKPWNILPEEYIGQAVCIRLTDVKTDEVKVFKSLREVERDLKISRFISKKYMNTGATYQNYLIEEIKDNKSDHVEIHD